MLRKKLDKTVCSPIVIRVAAGITRRKVLDGSSGPNEIALQKLKAKIDSAMPATSRRVPAIMPVSSLT
jgi:hypothetical protein